jgi:hypothetical protein
MAVRDHAVVGAQRALDVVAGIEVPAVWPLPLDDPGRPARRLQEVQ